MLLRLVLALTLLLTLGNAAGAADTAFRLATPSSPDSDVWNEGFSIVFSLDEKQCRAAYGKDWLERCAAPMPGMTGRTADTVSMRPAVPGVWRWKAPHILRFHPETSLKPATRYEISLADLPLPTGMRLRATKLQYTTSPQAVRIGKKRKNVECHNANCTDYKLRQVSAHMMGLEEFDEAEFEDQVEGITALEDGSLEFNFYGGRKERWQRA